MASNPPIDWIVEKGYRDIYEEFDRLVHGLNSEYTYEYVLEHLNHWWGVDVADGYERWIKGGD